MAIIKEYVDENAYEKEIFLVGDTVKLVDSPLDRLKKGAKGRVQVITGDMATDNHAMITAEFKVGGKPFILIADAERFRFSKHPKDAELPDSEAETPLSELEEGE